MNNYLKILTGLFIVAIIVTIIILSYGDLNPKESGLLSIILIFFSVGVTWIITHYYAEDSHAKVIADVKKEYQDNLRMYAEKAAEKVNNLSNELSRLSLYLQQELDYSGYDDLAKTLLAREERIESAIHLINTLKSVNDTSLSDWQGVIGEKLDQQREEKVEQEEEVKEEIKDVLNRLYSLADSQGHDTPDRKSSVATDKLQGELSSINNNIKLLLSSLTGVSWRNRSVINFKKSVVTNNCPACHREIKYKQRSQPVSIKPLDCPYCFAELKSIHEGNNNFSLLIRQKGFEIMPCPSCCYENKFKVDELMPKIVLCENCNSSVRVFKNVNGSNYKAVVITPQKHFLDNKIIEQIKLLLPSQPWPKNIHKEIAVKLNISHQVVKKAIQELIKNGVFLDQIDGIVYTLEEAKKRRENISKPCPPID